MLNFISRRSAGIQRLALAGLVAGLWLRGVTEGAARPGHHSLEEDETSAIAQKLAGLALRQQAGQADQ